MEPADKSPVFTTSLVMVVPGGQTVEFEEAWAKVADRVADTPGNVQQVLMRAGCLKDTYIVITKWRDEPTFREFERSRVQDDLTADLRRLRKGVVMSTSVVVNRIDGRDP